MTVPLSSDAFTRVCRWVEDQYADTRMCLRTGLDAMPLCDEERSSLNDLRSKALHEDLGSPARVEAWCHIAHHIREETGSRREERWTLIVLWLLTPRLRGAARVIARRTGAERADVCSALLQGALEGVRTLGRAAPAGAEQHLVDAAFAVAWQTGRRSPQETPIGEWDVMKGLVTDQLVSTTADCDLVRGDAMSIALAQRAQGERLGSLAYRLGLLTHVRRVRQLRRARPRPARTEAHPTPMGQDSLFEMRRSADDTPS
ncbi:hypothetical protein ACFXKG_06825 [Streptomyces sp. NPDC059255]|uniref:hypothetical protein n=1 Tax=Streptomyces sp. NPDC059255 TaxID=3346793 RepID=UPI0036C5CDD3